MLFFSKSKEKGLHSEDYEALLKRIAEVKHEIEEVKSKCAALETNYNDLRGKFNRKLNILKEQEEDDAIPQSLNTFSPFK